MYPLAPNDVRAYYDSFGEREWSRLDRSQDGVLEFALTVRTMGAHLTPASHILDIGGGLSHIMLHTYRH